MRHNLLRRRGRALATALILLGTLCAPSVGSAKNPHGSKIDDALAAFVDAHPEAQGMLLHVIVFGKDGEPGKPHLKLKRHLGLIGGESGLIPLGALDALATQKGISYIVLDSPVMPSVSSVSFSSLTTVYPTVDGAQTAWGLGYTGTGVGVAVIDSGGTASPDFGSRETQVLLQGQPSSADTYGHGTFVASVLAGASGDGRYVGIAPGASIYSVDVMSSSGAVYSSDVIAGLDWVAANAAANNIRIVNVSLAETAASSYLASALDNAVERLWQAGIVVVASSGNLGPNSMLYAPANDPFAVTVGAVDSADTASTSDDVVATFSSRGVTLDGYSKPDLHAPGRHIPALLPAATTLGQQAPAANWVASGYATMSGTSFAAPQVAAAAAILLQAHPGWTPDQVKWVLTNTTRPLAGATAGALDLAAAVTFSGTPASANAGIPPAPQQASGAGSAVTSTTSSWNTSGWNTSGWNTSGWNSYTWD